MPWEAAGNTTGLYWHGFNPPRWKDCRLIRLKVYNSMIQWKLAHEETMEEKNKKQNVISYNG